MWYVPMFRTLPKNSQSKTKMKLEVTIQKARDGRDYLQIMSEDYTSINIVLISEEITVKDQRPKK